MGYTHYWRQTRDLSRAEWAALTHQVKEVLAEVEVPLALGYESEEAPLIDGETIWFNGIGEDGHETFVLTRKRRAIEPWESDQKNPFEFCKTAGKPYDLAVCAVLTIAASLDAKAYFVSSDGEPEDWEPAVELLTRLDGIFPNPILQ